MLAKSLAKGPEGGRRAGKLQFAIADGKTATPKITHPGILPCSFAGHTNGLADGRICRVAGVATPGREQLRGRPAFALVGRGPLVGGAHSVEESSVPLFVLVDLCFHCINNLLKRLRCPSVGKGCVGHLRHIFRVERQSPSAYERN
jgi:hypothetical protein